MSYEKMLELVSNNPSKVFFGSYSALTRAYYEPEIEDKFIHSMLSSLDGDFMTASIHKFSESGGTDKPEIELFRTNSLIWAIDRFRIYCGQWFKDESSPDKELVLQILSKELSTHNYESVKQMICKDGDLHWWNDSLSGEENRKACYYAMLIGEFKNYKSWKWAI